MSDETKAALKSLLDLEEDRRRKRFQHLEAEFKNDPESLTDRDRLELFGLIVRSREIERAYYFEELMTQLSFGINAIDSENVRTAWKDFLASGAMPEEWDSKCDWVMAHCFEELGKPIHSVSVCEHMLSQMIGGDPNYRHYAEDCLSKTFEYYVHSKPSRRAREIVTLITTYHESDLVSDDLYHQALLKETELFYCEMDEVVERDRHLVEERLRLEMMETFDKLHAITRSHLVDAELWCDDRMRGLDPLAGPLRWALAIEAEFHYKVYESHKSEIAAALGRSVSPPKSCGPRDISDLLKLSSSTRVAGNVISKVLKRLTGTSTLASIDNFDALDEICEHRNQIAHVTTRGLYTLERCRALTKVIKESGWIYSFLSSLQPAVAK